nr:uncharacterized protein LOC104093649 [Nicotiana tomentosiformis]
MGDILPLLASPLPCIEPLYASRLGRIMMVSYQKCRRSWKAVVSILKMTRYPTGADVDPNLFGNERWWHLSTFVPWSCTYLSFMTLLDFSDPFYITIFVLVYFGVHILSWYSVCYWHREMSPYRLIGAKAKYMAEAIPMVVAAALRHLLEFNYYHFGLLLGCTTYFYIFAHFLHAAYDITGKDVLGAIAMLVLVEELNKELLVGALALSFCLGLSFYRYMTYSAPSCLVDLKVLVEDLCVPF